MDGNKDAAKQCVELGKKALKDGDKTRALKLFSKAKRLDPSLSLDSLMELISNAEDHKIPNEKPQAVNGSSNSGSKSNESHSAPRSSASAEQIAIVQRIQKSKDYYEILGVKKDCTVEEIKKAYKKISLKVHPDKNSAPGAEEAFKSVSKAFACLTDENTRAKYDQYGSEEPLRVRNPTSTRYRGGGPGFPFEDMFDADEIFNSFFFGSPYSSTFQRAQYARAQRSAAARQTRATNTSDKSNSWLPLLQLLPVLALFLISLFPLSKPIYSMEQVAPYEFKYSTIRHQVPFFVRSQDFDKDYPPGSSSRRGVEDQVERDHMEFLGYNCRRELSRQRWYPETKTPNCDKLRTFYVQ